jgi:hypothetical protein
MTAPGPKPEITAPQQQEGGAQVALATVARSPYHDRLAIAQRLTATYPSNTQWQLDLAVVYDRVGNVLVAQGKLDEALQAYRDDFAIMERLAGADRSNTDHRAHCRRHRDRGSSGFTLDPIAALRR